ncbi:hypothetical protein I552_9548 [Mycobacterium xenopi 3993]|nr:hypothetical protein I552_9548 [Mycobacterium xenopi 3993]
MDRAHHRRLSRRRRSGGQLQVQVGGSTTSRPDSDSCRHA